MKQLVSSVIGYIYTVGCVIAGIMASYLNYPIDLGEDILCELRFVSGGGSHSFPAEGATSFDLSRAKWRHGAAEFVANTMSLTEVDELVSDDDEIFIAKIKKPVPLSSIAKYLAVYWPEVYDDFPTKKQIDRMDLDDLISPDNFYKD